MVSLWKQVCISGFNSGRHQQALLHITGRVCILFTNLWSTFLSALNLLWWSSFQSRARKVQVYTWLSHRATSGLSRFEIPNLARHFVMIAFLICHSYTEYSFLAECECKMALSEASDVSQDTFTNQICIWVRLAELIGVAFLWVCCAWICCMW